MLSTDYNAEFERRIRMMMRIKEQPDLIPAVMGYYANNCIAWINDWCITFDPRNVAPVPRVLPFILFQRQEDLVNCILECFYTKQALLCEKTRDMGASWVCVAISAWFFIFHPGTIIGWGSRKEEYVDRKGDLKAIFPKIRLILENLPRWQLPVGFDLERHATHMKIINPNNGSAITGEAGDNIGRGGRTSMYFKDESSHYEHPEMVEAALGDNTNVQIDISSVNGSGNVFYRKRMAGEEWAPGKEIPSGITRVFIMDWRDHPLKTQAWYDERRAAAERNGLLHIFAQEVDRDYSSALDKIIIRSEWVRACIDAHKKLNIIPSGDKRGAQDVADGGGDKNAFAANHGVILTHISAWAGEAGEAAPIALRIATDLGLSEIQYDSIGVGTGFKVSVNNLIEKGAWPKSLKVTKWDAGSEPRDPKKPTIPGDKNSPLNEDQYANLKAQSWFRLRTRVYKTFMAVTAGEVYPHDELISFPAELPHLHELCMELSQATYKYSGSGKVLVDKVGEGSRSPNQADAVVMLFNPVRKAVGFFDLP